MTMPLNQVVTRPGQMQGTGDTRAIFLKLFSGQVLTQFRASNIALKLTKSRTISSGKSFQFPIVGRSKAKYHKPGELITAEMVKHSERTINVDDFAIAPIFIPEIDEALQHYETRSEYARDVADQLAELIDRNIFRMLAQAAFITDKAKAQAAGLNPLDEEVYTENVVLADESAKAFVDALYKARTQFRLKNISQAMYCVTTPTEFEKLVNAAGDVGSMAWMNKDVGGNGSVNADAPLRIAGIPIYESNHLPHEDESAGINDPEPLSVAEGGSGNTAKYRGDYSKVRALVFTQDAVATVKLKDITVQHVPEALRLGDNVFAKMAVGHGILRPCCAIAILAPVGVA